MAESKLIHSPYEFSSSDNPGTAISSVQLTGDNYVELSTKLENALRAKQKSGFINGTLPIPKDNLNEIESWNTVNSMIVGWIRASMSPEVRSTVAFTSGAHKLWIDLKKRFSIGNAVRVHQLKADLASCRQDGSSVMDYYGKLSAKWDELLTCKPLPKCTCKASESIVRDYEEEIVHQFLLRLDEVRFGNVCANIIGSEPLPDLNSVYHRVVREERRLESTRSEAQQETVGFLAKTGQYHVEENPTMSGFIAAVARTQLVCSHCGRSVHEKKVCWQIIGFPEWWIEKNQNGNQSGRGRGKNRGGSSSGRGGGRGGPQFRSNAASACPMSNSQLINGPR